jgi:hypothetical protein
MTLRHGLVFSLLAGCGGLSQDEFNDRYAEAYCTASFDCQEEGSAAVVIGDSVEDCKSFFEIAVASAAENCDYDELAAQECLDAVEGASCEDLMGSGSASCNVVYTGEECGSVSSSS